MDRHEANKPYILDPILEQVIDFFSEKGLQMLKENKDGNKVLS